MKNQEGSILFMTILLLAVIGILSVGLLYYAERERNIVDLTQDGMEKLHDAEDCLEQGIGWLYSQYDAGVMPQTQLISEGGDGRTVRTKYLGKELVESDESSDQAICSYVIEETSGVVAGSEVDESLGYGNSWAIGKQRYYKISAQGLNQQKTEQRIYSYVVFSL